MCYWIISFSHLQEQAAKEAAAAAAKKAQDALLANLSGEYLSSEDLAAATAAALAKSRKVLNLAYLVLIGLTLHL